MLSRKSPPSETPRPAHHLRSLRTSSVSTNDSTPPRSPQSTSNDAATDAPTGRSSGATRTSIESASGSGTSRRFHARSSERDVPISKVRHSRRLVLPDPLTPNTARASFHGSQTSLRFLYREI